MSLSPRKLTIGLAAVACIGISAPPALSEEMQMTAGAPFAPIFSWITALPEAVVKPANEKLAEAGVDLTIDWTEAYGGVLFKFNDTLEAVEQNIVDVGTVGTLWETSKMPLMNLTFSIPFASQNLQASLDVFNDLNRNLPVLKDAWARYDQVFLGAAGVETYHLWTKRPITSLDDLQGMKILGAGAVGAWINAAGATWVDGSGGTFYEQIQTGVADGAVWVFTGAYANKIHEVAPYVTLVGLGAQVIGGVTMNMDTWNRLPEGAQEVFYQLGEDYSRFNATEIAGLVDDYRERSEQEGAIIAELPSAEKERWAERMANLPKEWLELAGEGGMDVLKGYMDGIRAKGETPVYDWDKGL